MPTTQIKTISLPKSGVRIFYREQSPDNALIPEKVILLLHGFPSSSHQYRNLIPLLASRYRVVAPDLPGFGFTEAPASFKYTFEKLTSTMAEFLNELSISKFSITYSTMARQSGSVSHWNARTTSKRLFRRTEMPMPKASEMSGVPFRSSGQAKTAPRIGPR